MNFFTGLSARTSASSVVICSAISGCIAVVLISLIVGAITNNVRNSDRLTITELGGLCWMPIAVRNSDSTTTMRVKHVIMMRIDGASERIVIRPMICISRSVI